MVAHIGLIVPALLDGGGVPSVARFVRKTALQSGEFKLSVVSLSSSIGDDEGVRVLSPRSWLRGVRTSANDWDGVPIVHVGTLGGELEFQRYRRRKAVSDAVANCDILQVVCGSPAWANSVCELGKPVALQAATRARVERRRRDAQPRGALGLWRKAMTRVTDRLDDRALRLVDAIQVENPWMLEYARRVNVGRDVDIRYAPPGVDDTLFHPLVRRDLGGDAYILCVGRLDDPRKNIGLLVEGYARLSGGLRRRVRLVLAGSSGPPRALWSRAEALGVRDRVEYIPNPSREKLVGLYQRASVFALPSDEEGLGVVLLESMACGVPVVSTRSGGPDGVVTDGKDGFLVPLDDAEAMADRLGRLLRETTLNVSMGREARRTVEARYSERVAGDAFLDVWDRLLTKVGKKSCVG
ncbi:MAG: glycosyltransferase family 4 protein [Burkholderiales bacterium]|nr:glycosyltransferase family 4 protein [Burkholderiales bacterium]